MREKQRELVMAVTAGMYGDLQGIAGKTLPEIEVLNSQLLAQTVSSGDGN